MTVSDTPVGGYNARVERDLRARALCRGDLDADPLRQFERWLADARAAGIRMPEAMALASATAAGEPSVRMVLLKRFDERGFAFHTSYQSRKARELEENPRAGLLFYWDELGRQIRIEGAVERLSEDESEAYFRTRPVRAQLSAWASRQSEVIESRNDLELRVREVAAEYEGRDVPLPPFWGGYLLAPSLFEFWQHRENRLHDRFRYRSEDGEWVLERLSP